MEEVSKTNRTPDSFLRLPHPLSSTELSPHPPPPSLSPSLSNVLCFCHARSSLSRALDVLAALDDLLSRPGRARAFARGAFHTFRRSFRICAHFKGLFAGCWIGALVDAAARSRDEHSTVAVGNFDRRAQGAALRAGRKSQQ